MTKLQRMNITQYLIKLETLSIENVLSFAVKIQYFFFCLLTRSLNIKKFVQKTINTLIFKANYTEYSMD